jgi:ABC-type lipoprotein release transport system permease subunit
VFLIKLSFKNLTRHKRRTLITSSALAIGLIMYILIDSLLVGLFYESTTNLKDAETGDGKVIAVESFVDLKFLPLNNRVKNPDEVIDIVKSLGGRATKRVVINGDMIFSEEYFDIDGSVPVMFTAVDLSRDRDVYNILNEKFLEDGRFPKEGSDEIVIGSWLAEDIGARVGSWVTLSVRTAADGDDPGFFQTIDVEIVGIVKVNNPIINRKVLYIPLDITDYYLDLKGSVTEVAIRIPFGEDLEKFKADLNVRLEKDISFYTWEEIAYDYIKLLQAETGGSAVFVILTVLIAVVGVTNTMLMTINERNRELGMMRALGMSDRKIRIAFLIEAAGIGLFGSFIGVALGILLNIPLVNTGIDYSFWMRDFDMGYRISSYMRSAWNFRSILVAFIMGIVIPVLVSIIPTKRAILKSIPKCLYER